MATPSKQAFFKENAQLAIEQQIKYGIPASLTLAQMYWESGGGTSDVAKNANNYFGVKDYEGAAAGRPVYRHDDVDEKNAPFKIYSSKEASVEGHSEVLMKKNYQKCHSLASDDFHGWLTGIQTAPRHYAGDKNYVTNLSKDYKAYDLGKYDQMAIAEAQKRGVSCGYMRDKVGTGATVGQGSTVGQTRSLEAIEGFKGCMPIGNSMTLTCDYSPNKADSLHPKGHKGIDLSTGGKSVDLLASENGTVIKVDNNGKNKPGGNSLTVRYDRPDGSWHDVTYYHLEKSNVELGDMVTAGQQIAKTGNTGTHTTGHHLHMEVRDMNDKLIDPKDYLAEIAALSNISAVMVNKKTKEEYLTSRIAAIDVKNPNDNLVAQQQNQQQVDPSKLQATDPFDKFLSQAGIQNIGDLLKGDIVSSMMSMLLMAWIKMSVDENKNQKQAAGEAQGKDISAKIVPSEDEAYVMHERRHGESIDPQQAQQAHDMAQTEFDVNMEHDRIEEQNQSVSRGV